MEELELEVNFVVDLWVAVFDESNVEEEVVDTLLAARSVVGSVTRLAPGSLLLEIL